MKFKVLLLLGALTAVTGFIACDLGSHTEPEINVDNSTILGQGIFVNESSLYQNGLDSLQINQGDTVELVLTTALLKQPNYVFKSGDETILKIVKDSERSNVAWAIAIGDSGATTTLTISDLGNQATRTMGVRIESHWADPNLFVLVGNLDGHYYYISQNLLTWAQAKEFCEKAGGYLAAINSAEENDLLDQARGRIEKVWIGLKFNEVNDKWVLNEWVNGELLEYENFRSKPGDPGIFFEIYFHLDSDGKWENWHEQPLNYFLEME